MNTVSKMVKKYRGLSVASKSAMVFFACIFLQKAVNIISVPIFTRLFSTKEYGRFSVFNSWLDIISVIVSLRLYLGVFPQGLVKFEEDRRRFVSSIKGLNLVLVIVWYMFYLLSRSVWCEVLGLSPKEITFLFILIWTTAEIEFWYAESRVELKYKQVLWFTIFFALSKPIISILLVITQDDKPLARITGSVIVDLVFCVVLITIAFCKKAFIFSAKYWRYGIAFNILLVPHYLSQTILNSSDRLMIDRMVGEKEAGIYSLAYSVSIMAIVLNQAIMSFLSPWIYKNIRDDHIEKIKKAYENCAILVAVLNSMVILFAPEIIRIFAPGEYYDAVGLMPPIIMSVFFLFCYEFWVRFEFYYEKTMYVALGSIVCAMLNVVLNYFFIGIYGYTAAAYTTLISYIIYVFCHYIFVKQINNDIVRRMAGKRILIIGTCMTLYGFCVSFCYKYDLIRYMVAFATIIALLINRKKLIKIATSVIKYDQI